MTDILNMWSAPNFSSTNVPSAPKAILSASALRFLHISEN